MENVGAVSRLATEIIQRMCNSIEGLASHKNLMSNLSIEIGTESWAMYMPVTTSCK